MAQAPWALRGWPGTSVTGCTCESGLSSELLAQLWQQHGAGTALSLTYQQTRCSLAGVGLWGVKTGAPPCPEASSSQGAGREAERLCSVLFCGGTGLTRLDVRCNSDLGNFEVWGHIRAEGVGVAEA